MSRTESEKDAQARWIIRRDDPICTCKPENPKHREGWHCITKEQLGAWRKYAFALTDGNNLHLNDEKRLAWMWVNFSTHPEARRLSGRSEKHPGLDAWDDAAGMSELEKRMFE